MQVPRQTSGLPLSAWRMVVGLGLVSLTADMVADGGKALYGPLLGALGASALIVGLVTGAAEGVSLLLRLAVGPLADRLGNHWNWTIAGYAMTAVCIPLLAVAPFIGSAGLLFATCLIIAERVGKAVRSPSKTALLAHAAGAVGRGRGFGVHKTLDLIGAITGPLLVAAVLAATGAIWPSMLVLLVPGALTMVLLLWMRRRVPDPSVYEPMPAQEGPESATQEPGNWWAQAFGEGLPREFFTYAAAVGLTTGGLVSYAIVSFHFTKVGLIAVPAIPVVFSLAMAAAAIAALANGWLYDRLGPRVLLVLPLLVALVPLLTLTGSLGWALTGMVCWGLA
ncbi:MAG TPA: MFS transporter, partial [Propionicimonas sp.]|nr:MFS transporter [Propionicimonas sp.]